MATAKEILEEMGINIEVALEQMEKTKANHYRDKRICLCGHGVGRHDNLQGRTVCSALKYNCECKLLQPVLEVTDVRVFKARTEGSGTEHALTRGILAATKKDIQITWIEEEKYCHPCGATDVRLTPMAVSINGVPQSYNTGYNALFCDECRIKR